MRASRASSRMVRAAGSRYAVARWTPVTTMRFGGFLSRCIPVVESRSGAAVAGDCDGAGVATCRSATARCSSMRDGPWWQGERYDFVRDVSRKVSHRRGRFPGVAWARRPSTPRLRHMRLLRFLALFPLALPAALAAQGRAPVPTQPIDWPALEREGVALLRDYLRVNSTNPPGNELETARFLRDFLARSE